MGLIDMQHLVVIHSFKIKSHKESLTYEVDGYVLYKGKEIHVEGGISALNPDAGLTYSFNRSYDEEYNLNELDQRIIFREILKEIKRQENEGNF